MNDAAELRDRLHRLKSSLSGEPLAAAIEQLLEAVAESGDQSLLNTTLAELVDAYEFSYDPSRILVPFSRLVSRYAEAPDHFDSRLTHRFHWMFKWVIDKTIEHPEIPLDVVERTLSQMRERYAESGHSPHPVHEAEYQLADHLGDRRRAERAATAIADTEPDLMSNCRACRNHYWGVIELDLHGPERALAAWKPILEDGQRCAHQPHSALASSLMPLLELGRLDDARANHLRGYQLVRGKDDLVYALADHLNFCARTGNEARAVEIMAAHARYHDLELEAGTRIRLLEAVQVATAALVARGGADTPVPGPEHRTWRAGDLLERVDADRRERNARYDRRNGNDHQSRRSARAVAGTDHPHVPLGLRTDRAPASAPADTEAASAAPADLLRATVAGADPADAPGDPDQRTELSRAYDLAEAASPGDTAVLAAAYAPLLCEAGRFEQALAVARFGVASLRPDHPPALTASLNRDAAVAATALERWSAVEPHALAAAVAFTSAGQRSDAAAARHRLAVALLNQGRHHEAQALLDDVLSEQQEAEGWKEADLRILLSRSHFATCDHALAAEHALAALKLLDGPHPHPNPEVLPRTARLAGLALDCLNRPSEARDAYLRAADLWRDLGKVPEAAAAAASAAWLLADPETVVHPGDAELAALADELRDAADGAVEPEERRRRLGALVDVLNDRAEMHMDRPESVDLQEAAIDVAISAASPPERIAALTHTLLDELGTADDFDADRARAITDRVLARLAGEECREVRSRLVKHRDRLCTGGDDD